MARRSARVAERRGAQMNLSNPPFDKRILTLPGIAGVPEGLKRGRLVSMDLTNSSRVGWRCRFLYNPSTISLSHSVVDDTLAEVDRSTYDAATLLMDTQSTVTWQLLFDRTYETWDRAYADKPAGKYGVYADVRALYGMTGMVPQTAIAGLDLIDAPLLLSPVQVYFGGKRSLTYYGRIDSIGVLYTHWTTKMVPNRCVVDISLRIYPKVAAEEQAAKQAAKAASTSAAGNNQRSKRASEGGNDVPQTSPNRVGR